VDIEWRNAIFGSVAVHVLLVAAMLLANWDWSSTPQQNRTGLNIQARVVDVGQFQQQVDRAVEQRQQAERAEQQRLERERRAAQRDEALRQQRERDERANAEAIAERDRQQREQQQREQAEREQAEQQRLEQQRQVEQQAERDREAELQRQQQAEAERRRQEREARRQAEAEQQRQEEARRQRELDDIRQQREEAERRRQQEQQRLQQLEDQQRREDEIRRLLAEQQAAQQAAANAGRIGTLREQYIATIAAAVQAAWNRPPSAVDEIICELRIVQIPGGEVIDAVITSPCNADAATQRSIIAAVKRNDLPYRGFEEVFERSITFTFRDQENR